MSYINRTGEIHETENGFEWRINNFWSYLKKMTSDYQKIYFESPSFSYNDLSCKLKICSSGSYVNICLIEESKVLRFLEICVALKSVNNEKVFEKLFKIEPGHGDRSLYISSFHLMERQTELVPAGVLTMLITFRDAKQPKKCSYCKEFFDTESVLSHEKKCSKRPIKCSECSAVILVQAWDDHQCQKEKEEVLEKLMHDFETLINGDHADIIVKVQEVEFRLNKAILAVRNPYFHSMFNNDLIEKSTGIVEIKDCEPDIFRSFISFLYTGKVNLTPENVFALYQVAHKYQEDQLKRKCLRLMLNTLSVQNFCDCYILALTYDEKELLIKSGNFFTINQQDITSSANWQIFQEAYPMEAKELCAKRPRLIY